MKNIKDAFENRMAISAKLVLDAHATEAGGVYTLPQAERELITNACFLRMFIALEEFFEASFLHYAMGKMSTARWRPSKYVRSPSVDHLHSMLIGTQRYVDWSTPDVVRKLAKLYFEQGRPYEAPLAASTQHLLDMKTARNATAHVSRSTQASLDALQSRWTGAPTNGSSAYQLLLAPQAASGHSFLAVSDQTLRAIVKAIADNR